MIGTINEIFYSLQGEVPGLGEPSIFIRFTGCSMGCSWCDSKYAFDEGKKMSSAQVADEVKRLSNLHNTNNVIITGGEPTEQLEFLNELVEYSLTNYNVSLETNGQDIPVNYRHYNRIVVSPKKLTQDMKPIMRLYSKLPNVTFKIVYVSSTGVTKLIRVFDLPKDKIVIMPKGGTRQELRENIKKVWEFCHLHGYRMGYRLHIEIFDTKRGV